MYKRVMNCYNHKDDYKQCEKSVNLDTFENKEE